MALTIGSKAPEINLESTSGKPFTLSKDMAGKPCIIYFYPRDFTPGCTEEACNFRDTFAELRGLDIAVFGISRDSVNSHLKFKEEHQLPFELLADINGQVCRQYDALIPLLGIPKRITYLLDREHRIQACYQNMFGARHHVEQMIKNVKDPNN